MQVTNKEKDLIQRDAVIARLVEASEALQQDMMERARCGMDVIYGTEYQIVNAGRTAWDNFCSAISAAKGVKLAD